jgi:urease subunit alpha
MFGTFGGARNETTVTFVSEAANKAGIHEQLNLKNKISTVKNCRQVTKSDMVHNDWMPDISVDPQTYQVVADGELLECEPATELPLAQLYQLF